MIGVQTLRKTAAKYLNRWHGNAAFPAGLNDGWTMYAECYNHMAISSEPNTEIIKSIMDKTYRLNSFVFQNKHIYYYTVSSSLN